MLMTRSIDPSKRRKFKQFANTDERQITSEIITERGQKRPADWPNAWPPVKLDVDQLTSPTTNWTWVNVATKEDLVPSDAGTTSVAVKYGDTQLAVFYVPKRGYYATQQM